MSNKYKIVVEAPLIRAGLNVCLLVLLLSYVAVKMATTGEAQPYVEVCKPTEDQDQIRDIRKLLEVK